MSHSMACDVAACDIIDSDDAKAKANSIADADFSAMWIAP